MLDWKLTSTYVLLDVTGRSILKADMSGFMKDQQVLQQVTQQKGK
jgi:hypothetical protein